MDKQTFYAELTERLLKLGLSHEYIDRHLAQFDAYFKGKSDEEIATEIAKLGDLDKVAARIKRMTEKVINEAKAENEAKQKEQEASQIVNREVDEIKPVINISSEPKNAEEQSDDDVHVFVKNEENELSFDEPEINSDSEPHGTKRGEIASVENNASVTSAPIDPAVIEQNRRKFWIIFAATLPITLAVLAATAFGFGIMFFAVAVIILISIGGLIFVTAVGTLVSVFGLIFGVSQMISSLPVGLYECGVAIMIGAVAMAIGILVYNFAVRFMPWIAKLLMVFVRYVARKYRELYIYLKKECIGL